MTKADIKQNLNNFGQITGVDSKGYQKTFMGKMLSIDTADKVFCIDNDGVYFLFRTDKVKGFEPREFEGLPDKVHGKEFVDLGGKFVYTDSKKEVDFKK